MPAYRSDAEAEVRQAAVARLRCTYPNARVIHEININGGRADVLFVDRSEIITIEVKSAKDKLHRLKDQIKFMISCSHHTIIAMHEKFLVETATNSGAAHYERDGKFYRGEVPEVEHRYRVKWWVYPERNRAMLSDGWDFHKTWQQPKRSIETALPPGAIHLLWKNELLALCDQHGIATRSKWNMTQIIRTMQWHCTGKELTLGICKMLRQRSCIEADPPILEQAA